MQEWAWAWAWAHQRMPIFLDALANLLDAQLRKGPRGSRLNGRAASARLKAASVNSPIVSETWAILAFRRHSIVNGADNPKPRPLAPTTAPHLVIHIHFICGVGE
jgi:hypothetical protein